MRYLLKNKSNNTLDIMGKFIYPGDEINVNNINPYKRLISAGFLKIIKEDNNQLVTLPKNKYSNQINNYNINKKIIGDITNKYPLKTDIIKNDAIKNDLLEDDYIKDDNTNIDEQKNNIEQFLINKLDLIQEQINENINNKIDKILKEELISNKQLVNENIIIQNKIDNQEILNSLFHFYIDRNISSKDLENIKYFLITISEIKNIPNELKQQINSYEELITVLLNNIYPYLFSLI